MVGRSGGWLIARPPGVFAEIDTAAGRQYLHVKAVQWGWLLLESVEGKVGSRFHLLSLVDDQLASAGDKVEVDYPYWRFNNENGNVESTEDKRLCIKPREYGYWQAVDGESFSLIAQSAIIETGLLSGAAGSDYDDRLLLELTDRLIKAQKAAKIFEVAATYAAGVVGGLLDRDKRQPLAALVLSGESTISSPALAIVRRLRDLQQNLGSAGIKISNDHQLQP